MYKFLTRGSKDKARLLGTKLKQEIPFKYGKLFVVRVIKNWSRSRETVKWVFVDAYNLTALVLCNL